MDYVKECLRTEPVITDAMMARLTNPETLRLLHAAIGMVTEAGELIDMLKKHIFQGKPIDVPNAVEELGDSQWYQALAADVLNTTFDQIQEINIIKLKVRYPDKFSEYYAANRNLAAERRVLEQEKPYFCGICHAESNFDELIFDGADTYTCPCCGSILKGGDAMRG